MICAIHQAYFLPWLGYFSKLCFVDKFILLDNVQFTKGFYYDRTKYINLNGQMTWLSIPTGQNFKKLCNEVIIKDKNFLNNLIKTIESCYAKADFYHQDWVFLKEIIVNAFVHNDRLVNINLWLIIKIMEFLDLKMPEVIFSSSLEQFEDKTNRIIGLCNYSNCDSIVIGDGASSREHDLNLIVAANIKVLKQDFNARHPIYKQVRRQRLPFEKGVSIIDCLLNMGRIHTGNLIADEIYQPQLIQLNDNGANTIRENI